MEDEKVKVTIRLPKALVRTAKHHAMLRGQDLQDMVKVALTDHLRRQPPAVMDAADGRELLKAMFGHPDMPDKEADKVVAELAKRAKASRKKGTKR
jgi:hypothetical protein